MGIHIFFGVVTVWAQPPRLPCLEAAREAYQRLDLVPTLLKPHRNWDTSGMIEWEGRKGVSCVPRNLKTQNLNLTERDFSSTVSYIKGSMF